MVDGVRNTISNINAFSNKLEKSGLDYQVIMLSAKGTNLTDTREDVEDLKGSGLVGDMPIDVCVPPPLGVGPGGTEPCGDNAPRFHHLDNYPFGVTSRNGMWLAIGMYNRYYTWADDSGPEGGGWAKWARFDAIKHFIVITDDDARVPGVEQGDASIIGNATEPWDVFDRLILGDHRFGPPGMFGSEDERKYVYNTVCGWAYPGGDSASANDGGGCIGSASESNPIHATSPGTQHQKLAVLTGGVVESVCRSDWSFVFDRLADKAINAIGCEIGIPSQKDNPVDSDKVLVRFTDAAGSSQDLPRVSSKSECDQATMGWYYDSKDSPKTIVLCPNACDAVGATSAVQLDVFLGCLDG